MRSPPGILALALSCALALPAFAQTGAGQDLAADATAPVPLSPVPLSLDVLADASAQGVDATVLSDQQLSATSSGNSLVAAVLTTGDISFSTDALTGFAGVGNFVINTGANSSLQGTISVNIITTAPAP